MQTTSLLRERSMGEIEGMLVSDALNYAAKKGKNYKEFGEDKQDYVSRLINCWNGILEQETEKGSKHIVIVSHGGKKYNLLINLNV